MTEQLKALTANHLASGEVLFKAVSGWTTSFGEALIFEDDAIADSELAEAKAATEQIIDPYLIDVAAVDGFPVPTSYRERIRALGPTPHPDMGKQAEGGALISALQQAKGAARSSGRLGLIRRR